MNFSRCQGICPTSDINRNCLIYFCLIYLASCSLIMPWFWAFLGQGRLPEGTELQSDIENSVLRERETNDFSLKVIYLPFGVGSATWVCTVYWVPAFFSLLSCVPNHIHLHPWCSTMTTAYWPIPVKRLNL